MKFKRQPTIRGVTREQVGAAILSEIEDQIRDLQLKYKVSRSWVIATVLADAFDIKAQPRFYNQRQKPQRKKKTIEHVTTHQPQPLPFAARGKR